MNNKAARSNRSGLLLRICLASLNSYNQLTLVPGGDKLKEKNA